MALAPRSAAVGPGLDPVNAGICRSTPAATAQYESARAVEQRNQAPLERRRDLSKPGGCDPPPGAVDGALSVHGCGSVHAAVARGDDARPISTT